MISKTTAIACLLIVNSINSAGFVAPIWDILAKVPEANNNRKGEGNQIVPIKSDIKLVEGKMEPESIPKEEAAKNTPHKILYVTFTDSATEPGDEKSDFALSRLNRQKTLAEKSNNIVKYEYVGREYNKDQKKVNYVTIEEQQITNLNNYLKDREKETGAKLSLEQKVDIMAKMSDVLVRLHMEGIKHCHVYVKKFAVMPDQTLKVRGLGFVDEKTNACVAENVEVTDPRANQIYQMNVVGSHKNRFFEDIYGLGFAFISLIDVNQDNAVKNNALLNDDKQDTGIDMTQYINNMTKTLADHINNKAENIEQKENTQQIDFVGQLHLFIIETLNKLILSMVTGDIDKRPSSIDVLETLEALLETIVLTRQEPEFYKAKGQINKAFVYASRKSEMKRSPVYLNLKSSFLSDFIVTADEGALV